MKSAIVVGGGLAGLTAARRLLIAGYSVRVIEKRDVLGGKWSAWRDADGDWIETGLHVFFGAYEEIFDLMKELNIYDRILWKEHVLTYTLAEGERFAFRTAKLPSPLHLLPAVFENRYFGWLEKLSLGRALFPMLFGSREYIAQQDAFTYQQWHRRFGIADRMLKKMFLPMTLALKFLPPEKISAKIVLDVTGTFLRQNSASRIGFLRGSPEEHLTQPIAQDILRRGGEIKTGLKLRDIKLKPDGMTIAGITCTNGNLEAAPQELAADHYVFALPIHNLQKVLPTEWDSLSYFRGLKQIGSVPVLTLHLWMDAPICGYDNILFSPDGLIPVYADMSLTTPDYECGGSSRFQFVVAPATELIDKSDEEIFNKVMQTLHSVYPYTAPQAKVKKYKVVRVPKSVYWPGPNTDVLRVPQLSPVSNLALAGGYTKQRFYDSMEGAVRSGNRAAEAIISRDEGMPWQERD